MEQEDYLIGYDWLSEIQDLVRHLPDDVLELLSRDADGRQHLPVWDLIVWAESKKRRDGE